MIKTETDKKIREDTISIDDWAQENRTPTDIYIWRHHVQLWSTNTHDQLGECSSLPWQITYQWRMQYLHVMMLLSVIKQSDRDSILTAISVGVTEATERSTQ